jgi:hypothetical protein
MNVLAPLKCRSTPRLHGTNPRRLLSSYLLPWEPEISLQNYWNHSLTKQQLCSLQQCDSITTFISVTSVYQWRYQQPKFIKQVHTQENSENSFILKPPKYLPKKKVRHVSQSLFRRWGNVHKPISNIFRISQNIGK